MNRSPPQLATSLDTPSAAGQMLIQSGFQVFCKLCRHSQQDSPIKSAIADNHRHLRVSIRIMQGRSENTKNTDTIFAISTDVSHIPILVQLCVYLALNFASASLEFCKVEV